MARDVFGRAPGSRLPERHACPRPQLLGVERKPVRKLDGSPVESIPVLMRSVEYFLVIQDVDPTEGVSLFEAVDKARHLPGEASAHLARAPQSSFQRTHGHHTRLPLASSIRGLRSPPPLRPPNRFSNITPFREPGVQVKVAESIVVPHKTKRGRRAKRDLRAGLAELEVVEARASPLGRFAGDIVDRVEAEGHPWVALRAKGPVEGGQVRLRADDVRRMLQEVVDEASGVSGKKAASSAKDGRRFIVAHVHRAGFEMGEPKAVRACQLCVDDWWRDASVGAMAVSWRLTRIALCVTAAQDQRPTHPKHAALGGPRSDRQEQRRGSVGSAAGGKVRNRTMSMCRCE